MSDLFYRAFEEKHRGSRELIKSRLEVYIPFIQPLLNYYPLGKALDVGCGRGEWLEMLGELGFDALGIDIDDGMLQACRERCLNVETADVVAYLQDLPDASLCIVSGFHVAEHLPFSTLQQLVQDAFRVLVPGGLLILETPNPENIVVGTCSFYLDPTHQRPIPPELLSFLPEYYGFSRFKVLRLQESLTLRDESNIGLLQVLNGVSPDYAVIAQKLGAPSLMELVNPPFHKNYGLTLHNLGSKHEQTVERRLIAIEAKAHQAQEQAMHAEVKAQQAEATVQLQATRLEAVYESTSWRVTAPFRWAANQGHLLHQHGLKSRFKSLVKKILRKVGQEILRRPRVRSRLLDMSQRLGLYYHLKRLHFRVSSKANVSATELPLDVQELSPFARRIHARLKIAASCKSNGEA